MMSLCLRFPEGKKKAVTLSYDDGVLTDRRLIQIMDDHGLKGTFNINSDGYGEETDPNPCRRMSRREVLETYDISRHEVAVHGSHHPWLERLPKHSALYEVIEDRRQIERMFGCPVRGMAYPFGTFSDEVIEALRAAGIVYSRTTRQTEGFELPKEWLTLDATCHHNNPKLKELAKRFVEEEPAGSPWLFYVWGHSYEFENNRNWDVIEDFAQTVGNREDVWYATNIQIYDYVKAFENLISDVDCTMLYNPGALDIWVEARLGWDTASCRVIKIGAGQTVKL